MPVLPFPRAKATELPQEPRLEQHRGEMDPAGERGYSPTSPQTSTHVPYTILPDWGLCRAGKNQAQNVSEEEGEGRNKSKFLVDVFLWPSPDQLLQLSTAQHLFAPHTSRASRGAAKDPCPAEHSGNPLGVKGWLAQVGCWSTWYRTGTPAALLPGAKRGAHMQLMVPTQSPWHSAELSLPPRMSGRCDSR